LGKVIAICNQKGGVGKTTTSVNLSAYLATIGKRTLVVDIDPQANATSGIGADKELIQDTVYSVLINQATLENIIIQTQITNLYLAPADVHLTGAQVELVGAFSREQKLKNSLLPIRNNYDFIFIDCPPSLGLLTVNALAACDTVMIPLQCEYYAMEGLTQLLHTIKLVQESLNTSLEIEGVVLTMADYRTNLTNEVIAEAKEFFKEKIYNTIVPRSVKLSEAPGYAKPIVLYDQSSHGAQAYRQLAEEFLSHNTLKTLEIEQSGGKDGEKKSAGQGAQGLDWGIHSEELETERG